ncbi:MAG: hypothetical protein HYT87_14930 [Nitrospirae bacterium]|nr:hypothetical protein [Nitrospirota bacterium]
MSKSRPSRRLARRLLVLASVGVLVSCGGESGPAAVDTGRTEMEGLVAWTKNPSLQKGLGLWEARTFCWTIGGDCRDNIRSSRAEWTGDGNVYLRAEDENMGDLGTHVAALTQGTDFDGHPRGTSLLQIRNGDVEAAYILFDRSDAGATGCSGVAGSGNIINFWLRHPETGARWVTDFYFETVGLNAGFGERAAPHNEFVQERTLLGIDWYAYQFEITKFPDYWSKTVDAEGVEHWVINLKALLDRGAAFSGRDLKNYVWHYVEVVSENVCAGGKVGESASWQRVHYFEIRMKLR